MRSAGSRSAPPASLEDEPRPRRSGRGRAAPVALGLSALLVLTACGPDAAGGGSEEGAKPPGAGSETPVAVATTTQLGSLVSEITQCAGTESATVMGSGDDPHDFSPSSRQIAQMTAADLVVANGLGLEAGMESALENAEADGATVLEVAPELNPLPFAAEDDHDHASEHADGHAHEHAHDHGDLDPHVWMDAGRMAAAAGLIGDRLTEVSGDERHAQCGEQVESSLQDTDEQIHRIMDQIPEDRRTVVTDHAAYHYLADAYGLEVSGVVIPGGSTDAEPSSRELAALVEQIDDAGADAILTSKGAGGRLVHALSEETVEPVPVVELYESGVGPEGSGAQTYAEAMLYNARALAEALA